MRSIKKSKSIAAIVGPTLILMVSAELKYWNASLYEHQIAPLVYLSGVLLFIAGLSIVRSHNVWVAHWPTLVTMAGWISLLLGTVRMFFPQMYLDHAAPTSITLAVEFLLITIGAVLTFKAYKIN